MKMKSDDCFVSWRTLHIRMQNRNLSLWKIMRYAISAIDHKQPNCRNVYWQNLVVLLLTQKN